MRTLFSLAFAGLLLAPGLEGLRAQSPEDLTGSWILEQETPRGTMTQTLTFAFEDGAWVGTMANDRRTIDLQEVTFEDGVVAFSFEAGPPPGRGGQGRGGPGRGGQGRRGGGEGPSPERSFEGVLEGDEITGAMKGPRGEVSLVLRRREG